MFPDSWLQTMCQLEDNVPWTVLTRWHMGLISKMQSISMHVEHSQLTGCCLRNESSIVIVQRWQHLCLSHCILGPHSPSFWLTLILEREGEPVLACIEFPQWLVFSLENLQVMTSRALVMQHSAGGGSCSLPGHQCTANPLPAQSLSDSWIRVTNGCWLLQRIAHIRYIYIYISEDEFMCKVVIFGLQTFGKLPHQDLSVGIELYQAVILWPCSRFNLKHRPKTPAPTAFPHPERLRWDKWPRLEDSRPHVGVTIRWYWLIASSCCVINLIKVCSCVWNPGKSFVQHWKHTLH